MATPRRSAVVALTSEAAVVALNTASTDTACGFCATPREPLLTHECEPGARADTALCRACFAEFGGDRDGDGHEFVLDDDTKK